MIIMSHRERQLEKLQTVLNISHCRLMTVLTLSLLWKEDARDLYSILLSVSINFMFL